MVKPETTFIASVHKHIPNDVYRMKNNNPYIGGIADCWYSGRKTDLWIEYKFVVVPKKADIHINLSTLQLQWLRGRYEEGRNVAVIVGCKDGGTLLTNLSWERSIPLEKFQRDLVARKELAAVIHRYTHG